MLHDRVRHAPHEIFACVLSATRSDDDQVGPLTRGDPYQLSPWRSSRDQSFRGKSVVLQRSYHSGRELLGFTSERSLHLVAHRKGLRGKADAFQREGRDDSHDCHGRTMLLR